MPQITGLDLYVALTICSSFLLGIYGAVPGKNLQTHGLVWRVQPCPLSSVLHLTAQVLGGNIYSEMLIRVISKIYVKYRLKLEVLGQGCWLRSPAIMPMACCCRIRVTLVAALRNIERFGEFCGQNCRKCQILPLDLGGPVHWSSWSSHDSSKPDQIFRSSG